MSSKLVGMALEAGGLTSAEKLILVVLADHCNKDGTAWPSKSSIARKCGVTPRHVVRVVAKLESLGILLRSSRKNAKGRQTSNVFHLSEKALDRLILRDDLQVTPDLPVTHRDDLPVTPRDDLPVIPITLNSQLEPPRGISIEGAPLGPLSGCLSGMTWDELENAI